MSELVPVTPDRMKALKERYPKLNGIPVCWTTINGGTHVWPNPEQGCDVLFAMPVHVNAPVTG